MNKLEILEDIVADTYDGCYEVMRECIKAYANIDITYLDLNDLDLVVMIPIGTWTVSTEKKKQLVYASHLKEEAKEKIASLMDNVNKKSINNEYLHTQEGSKKECWGMFGTGFRSVAAVSDDYSTAQDFIKMLVSLLNTPEENLYTLVNSTLKNKPLLGLQAGVISQVLHCLFPTVFPILNSWGRDIFHALRLRLIKADQKQTYISNCETIKMYRDKYCHFKNYRVIDNLTMDQAREIGFGFFIENYSAPKTLLKDIDTILSKYISTLTEEYNSLYQIPDKETAIKVRTILRSDKDFMKKSEAMGHHRPASCLKKYIDYFSWWMNPEDSFAQKEIFKDEDFNEVKNEEYNYNSDLDKPFISEKEFKKITYQLKTKKNIILEGAPGVGKTFLARKIAYQLMGFVKNENIEMVQFHQSYGYEDFVQGIRPTKNGGFERRNGIFFDFCEKARRSPNQSFIFIIDEINRGNISKILGELMMLIEADKRKEEFAIKLTYSTEDDDRFFVPENVYLIGCMNTADRSLAIVDYALRRRFRFCTIEPEFNDTFKNFIVSKGISKDHAELIISKIKTANNIIASIDNGLEIGHSYFCNTEGCEDFAKWWDDICEYELFPYIREICFDDTEKCEQICNILR